MSRLIAVLLSTVAILTAASNNVIRPYKISDVTVSGVSSGGYMAVQFQVAHSALVSGAGIFAAGPFYCAESNAYYATHKCMEVDWGLPQVEKLVALTYSDALLLDIDPPSNLKDDKVYLFSGSADTVIDRRVVESLEAYYQFFMPASNIVADYNFEAQHCMPTVDYGETCTTLASPYLGNCKFDGAGNVFQTLYGSTLVKGTAVDSNLYEFDQREYIYRAESSISAKGFIYVPTNCSSGAAVCHLHVSFHGCEQNFELIGNAYAAHSGFNAWAEANNIIVVYPYVSPSSLVPYNPNGCWDWWAYSGVDYGVKTGVQIRFIKQLVDDLMGGAFAKSL